MFEGGASGRGKKLRSHSAVLSKLMTELIEKGLASRNQLALDDFADFLIYMYCGALGTF